MSDSEAGSDVGETPQLQEVEYHAVTGIPEEYNSFLPKDTDEYKRLKSHKVSELASALRTRSAGRRGACSGAAGRWREASDSI